MNVDINKGVMTPDAYDYKRGVKDKDLEQWLRDGWDLYLVSCGIPPSYVLRKPKQKLKEGD